MISAAICWASAALPPLPIKRILLPERSALMMTSAIARAVASNAPSPFARSRAASDCFKWAPIRSFGCWLKKHRQGCKLASLVMIASRLRKRERVATLMRNAGSGLGQHALGDRNHVGCRNVPHAAMVVHGADRAMAGLAGHHGFGLDRRGEPVPGRAAGVARWGG